MIFVAAAKVEECLEVGACMFKVLTTITMATINFKCMTVTYRVEWCHYEFLLAIVMVALCPLICNSE